MWFAVYYDLGFEKPTFEAVSKCVFSGVQSLDSHIRIELKGRLAVPEQKRPIVGRWVIISTDRAQASDRLRARGVRSKADSAPFCYGNEGKTPSEILAYRPSVNGGPQKDAAGWTVRVVPNKFPALASKAIEQAGRSISQDERRRRARSDYRDSRPRDHSGDASLERIEDVLWAFRDRILDLKKDRRFKYILIFQKPRRSCRRVAGASQLAADRPADSGRFTSSKNTGREAVLHLQRTLRVCDIIRRNLSRHAGGCRDEDFITLAP